MKDIIKDNTASVGYLLLVGFLITILVAGGAFMFFNDIYHSFNLPSIYVGTSMDGYMSEEDIWYGNMFNIVIDNSIAIVLLVAIIGLYLKAQRIGDQGG